MNFNDPERGLDNALAYAGECREQQLLVGTLVEQRQQLVQALEVGGFESLAKVSVLREEIKKTLGRMKDAFREAGITVGRSGVTLSLPKSEEESPSAWHLRGNFRLPRDPVVAEQIVEMCHASPEYFFLHEMRIYNSFDKIAQVLRRDWENVQDLNIGQNILRPEGVQALIASPVYPRLTHLNLNETYPGPEGIEALASSEASQGLTHLELRRNGLSHQDIQVLASSPNLRSLESLHLAHNSIRPESILAILDSEQLANLSKLYLWGAEIDGQDYFDYKKIFERKEIALSL